MNRYYLYRHIRLDKNEPFYVGIGTKSIDYKNEYERAFDKSSRNEYWKNIVNVTKYNIEIMLESDDYQYIKSKEIEFIALYKRKISGGILCNLTAGGEGYLNPSEEMLLKIREPVYQYDLSGKFIKEWSSISKASSELNISKSAISNCCSRRLKSCKGFLWFRMSEFSKEIIENMLKNNKKQYINIKELFIN